MSAVPGKHSDYLFSGGYVDANNIWHPTINGVQVKENMTDHPAPPGTKFVGVLKSKISGFTATVAPGEELHFQEDDRDFLVQNGRLAPLDGALGSAASGATADVSGTITSLISLRTQLDALIAKLKS